MAPTADPQAPPTSGIPLVSLLTLLSILLMPSYARAFGPSNHISSLTPRSLPPSISGNTVALPNWFSDLVQDTTVTTITVTPVNPFLRLKDLRPDSEMPGSNGVRSSSRLLSGNLVAESELSRNLPDSTASIRGESSDQRMIRLALMSAAGSVRYGLAYRLAGKEFVNAPDQQIKELWGEWSHGHARLRTSVGEFSNNIDADPARPRTVQTQGTMLLTYARPSWPEFSLSYTRSLIEGSGTMTGLVPQKSLADRLEGAVAIVRPNWNARMSSSYVVANDQLPSRSDTVSYIQTISSAFRLLAPITFTSMLMYRSDVQEWTGVRIHQPTASFSITYDCAAQIRFSALGGYGSTRSSDGLLDNESLNSKGILTWYPLDTRLAQVSFETGYSRTIVGGSVQMMTEDISGLVRFKLRTN
ncbi:MAG: hypothetical protein NW703_04975 [Nitrospiraceae bacterium]